MVVSESTWWPVAWLESSSKFSLVSPMTFLNCIFVDMTAASYKPPKCDDLSGLNFTVMMQKSVTLSWLLNFHTRILTLWLHKSSYSSSLLVINFLRAAKNVSVVGSNMS